MTVQAWWNKQSRKAESMPYCVQKFIVFKGEWAINESSRDLSLDNKQKMALVTFVGELEGHCAE